MLLAGARVGAQADHERNHLLAIYRLLMATRMPQAKLSPDFEKRMLISSPLLRRLSPPLVPTLLVQPASHDGRASPKHDATSPLRESLRDGRASQRSARFVCVCVH